MLRKFYDTGFSEKVKMEVPDRNVENGRQEG